MKTRKNVYEAARSRIAYLFREFSQVLVAFSGGKDSTVCMEMCYDYAKEHNLLGRLSMYHIDYEAQYAMTTQFVDESFDRFEGVRRFRLCLPVKAQCACSAKARGYWIPWEKAKKDIWVRPMPEGEHVISEDNQKFGFRHGMTDYETQERFSRWFADTYGKTAVVVGIRSEESLNRWAAVNRDEKKSAYKGVAWMTEISRNAVNAYIIHDWKVEDVWTYLGRAGRPYNRLYDLYYKAGLKLSQMRVASPFNDCAIATLKLYKVIDPNNWGRMIGRVDGVNFAGLYGDTVAMGWKKIKLPEGHTWKSYLEFLMGTLDEKARAHYQRIFDVSLKYWLEKGGNIDRELLKEVEAQGVPVKRNADPKRYPHMANVTFEEYPDDIDVSRFSSVPSYKRMCVCILKNDYFCKYMGFGLTKEAEDRKRRTIEKYKNL